MTTAERETSYAGSIDAIVAAAPPLSPAIRARIRKILAPVTVPENGTAQTTR
jgi:hypothetical protein